MSISLKKGEKISLVKKGDIQKLNEVIIGLGWDEAKVEDNKEKKGGFLSFLFGGGSNELPVSIDCDAAVYLLEKGKLRREEDIVFFGNKSHKSGAVKHSGDNLTGKGTGDDERIFLKLSDVPSGYDRIVAAVNIYNATSKKQNFGMIKNAYIRIINKKNNKEICRYNLSENYQDALSMIFGELVLENDEWIFNALGKGTKDKNIREIGKNL